MLEPWRRGVVDGRTRVAYDTVTSQIASDAVVAASKVAERHDTEVLDLPRQPTGVPASAAPLALRDNPGL
jgi:hypothetical protein